MRQQHTQIKGTHTDWLSEESRDEMRGNERGGAGSDITEASWVKGGRLDHHLESYWGSGEDKLQKKHTRTEAMQEANPQKLVLVCLSVMAGF